MVPRGLRWDIHPQQDEVEVETWFHYFNEAGINLLGFLIDRKRNRLTLIDREIKELQEIKEKLLPHKSTPEYLSLSANLKSHLEKKEKDQRIKKQKKYTRDTSDYKNNLVFNWQKMEGGTPTETSGSVEMDASPPLDPSNRMVPTAPVTHDIHANAQKTFNILPPLGILTDHRKGIIPPIIPPDIATNTTTEVGEAPRGVGVSPKGGLEAMGTQTHILTPDPPT